jgi:hypothetical protein
MIVSPGDDAWALALQNRRARACMNKKEAAVPQPTIPQTPARVIPHMPCPSCHDVMTLSVLAPGADGQDALTFKCRACGHSETFTARR